VSSNKEGDLLEAVVEENGALRLIPKVAVDRTQAYFWSKHWQQGEREAEEDLRSGRFEDFESMDNLIRALRDEANGKPLI
jgi:hypothetical protein